ncbi:MAG: pentapeptide repeat-containing protein [Flavobacteriaceae bacterium]|nr:pentapeptide repeat-containing protein [Flavobacteriaceae bacterium]
MKNKITLLSFFLTFTSLVAFSQKTVDASDIIKDIKAGKSISISNATIVGDLDFTDIEEKLKNLPRKKRWWNNKGSNTIKNLIDTEISFVNCTFQDDVLAYIPDGENSGYTFIANFENDVIFKNCTFERKAMFKYSKFERNASFENAKFQEDSTFKYAEFDNFISFANTVFEETATFKYTKFRNGVSFNNAKFEEDLNIKYTEVRGRFDISGMKVAYDIDSKYTKINGKSFSRHLLNNQ